MNKRRELAARPTQVFLFMSLGLRVFGTPGLRSSSSDASWSRPMRSRDFLALASLELTPGYVSETLVRRRSPTPQSVESPLVVGELTNQSELKGHS